MRILFFVNAWALAHVSRAVEISHELKDRGHEVLIAGAGDYLHIAKESGSLTKQIDGPTQSDLNEVFEKGNIHCITNFERMKNDLLSSIKLCDQWRPDIIVSDNRLIARTVGDIKKIPVITIMNAHITNYQKYPFLSWPDKLSFLPEAFRDRLHSLQNKIERLFMNWRVFVGLRKLRENYGLDKLYAFEHEHGHLTLMPDIEKINPTRDRPDNLQYVGPITWKPHLPTPECLLKLDPEIPTIYFSLGSYALRASEKLFVTLSSLPFQFILVLGSEENQLNFDVPKNIFIETFVSVDKILPRCQAMICHGGNGTIYQALSYGVPVVGIPRHPEQSQGLKQLVRLKLGLLIKGTDSQLFDGGLLKSAINTIIEDSEFRANAIELAKCLRKENGITKATLSIEAFAKDQGVNIHNLQDKHSTQQRPSAYFKE